MLNEPHLAIFCGMQIYYFVKWSSKNSGMQIYCFLNSGSKKMSYQSKMEILVTMNFRRVFHVNHVFGGILNSRDFIYNWQCFLFFVISKVLKRFSFDSRDKWITCNPKTVCIFSTNCFFYLLDVVKVSYHEIERKNLKFDNPI